MLCQSVTWSPSLRHIVWRCECQEESEIFKFALLRLLCVAARVARISTLFHHSIQHCIFYYHVCYHARYFVDCVVKLLAAINYAVTLQQCPVAAVSTVATLATFNTATKIMALPTYRGKMRTMGQAWKKSIRNVESW